MLFAKRNARFETWLDTNGYYYVKNKSNKPCFKSKLTVHLFKHFKEDTSCYKKTIFDRFKISIRNVWAIAFVSSFLEKFYFKSSLFIRAWPLDLVRFSTWTPVSKSSVAEQFILLRLCRCCRFRDSMPVPEEVICYIAALLPQWDA